MHESEANWATSANCTELAKKLEPNIIHRVSEKFPPLNSL